jgi:4-diphosphocytidyl-2-C-methyl-D-erythritol kinase
VIVRPPFGVSTADAYRWVAESRAGSPRVDTPFDPPARAEEWLGRLAGCRNDFEPVVAARHPEIVETVRALRDAGAVQAMMSGSGSAVFGLFTDDGGAAHAMAQFAGRLGWSRWLTRTRS